ncbi:MAG: hypothetical protein NVSMB9_35690 [Isosphaeraceae bacterium]
MKRFRNDPRVYLWLGIGLSTLMVAFSVAPIGNNLLGWQNKDYDLWYLTGRTIWQGGAIYPTDNRPFPFMYPPAAASLLAILSLASPFWFVFILLILNSAAWVGSVLLSVRLATGAAFRQRPLLYALPTLWVLPFIHDMYLLGQPNLLLLLLMLGAFAALRRRLPWMAGALVGLAAAIKAFPVLALGYLVYRRHWKAVGASILTMVFLLLVLPIPFRGARRAWDDMAVWTRGMVLKYDEGQIAQRPERCYSFKNQSLVSVVNRLLRRIEANGEAQDDYYVNAADLSFRSVNAIVVVASLGLALFYLASMPWKPPGDARTLAGETAMLLLMVLIFSPFAFNYFYVWLLYPLTVLLARLFDHPEGSRERYILLVGLLAALELYAWSALSLKCAQAYGNLLAVNLLLLGLLGWSLRLDRAAGGPSRTTLGAGSSRDAGLASP